MLIREKQEQQEHEILNPYASFSDQSRGRDREEEQCDLRTVYQRDRDRIIHCKAFRRSIRRRYFYHREMIITEPD